MSILFKSLVTGVLLFFATDTYAQQFHPADSSGNIILRSDTIMLTAPVVLSGAPYSDLPPLLRLPAYTQGIFCDFEDNINRGRRIRIDFSVK